MPDVFAVADRIVVLRRGIKVADKPTAETSPEEITGLITGAIERGLTRSRQTARWPLEIDKAIDRQTHTPLRWMLVQAGVLGVPRGAAGLPGAQRRSRTRSRHRRTCST